MQLIDATSEAPPFIRIHTYDTVWSYSTGGQGGVAINASAVPAHKTRALLLVVHLFT